MMDTKQTAFRAALLVALPAILTYVVAHGIITGARETIVCTWLDVRQNIWSFRHLWQEGPDACRKSEGW